MFRTWAWLITFEPEPACSAGDPISKMPGDYGAWTAETLVGS